jgi:membrane-bound metal-dependent hydrolase YbcI (DUF457 family)
MGPDWTALGLLTSRQFFSCRTAIFCIEISMGLWHHIISKLLFSHQPASWVWVLTSANWSALFLPLEIITHLFITRLLARSLRPLFNLTDITASFALHRWVVD